MNRFLILLTTFLLFFILPCAPDESMPPVDTLAPHIVIGKWKSESSDVDRINYELAFESNGLMSLTTLDGRSFLEKEIYSYKVTSPEIVEFDYMSTINGQRVSAKITVKPQSPNLACVECFITGHPEAIAMRDAPRLCLYTKLQRVE